MKDFAHGDPVWVFAVVCGTSEVVTVPCVVHGRTGTHYTVAIDNGPGICSQVLATAVDRLNMTPRTESDEADVWDGTSPLEQALATSLRGQAWRNLALVLADMGVTPENIDQAVQDVGDKLGATEAEREAMRARLRGRKG